MMITFTIVIVHMHVFPVYFCNQIMEHRDNQIMERRDICFRGFKFFHMYVILSTHLQFSDEVRI